VNVLSIHADVADDADDVGDADDADLAKTLLPTVTEPIFAAGHTLALLNVTETKYSIIKPL
jgi:hypothetical protein